MRPPRRLLRVFALLPGFAVPLFGQPTLADLESRLYPYRDPQLSEARAVILRTEVRTAIALCRAQGMSSEQINAALEEQASQYEQAAAAARNGIFTAADTQYHAALRDALQAVDSGRPLPASISLSDITGESLRWYIFASWMALANREVAHRASGILALEGAAGSNPRLSLADSDAPPPSGDPFATNVDLAETRSQTPAARQQETANRFRKWEARKSELESALVKEKAKNRILREGLADLEAEASRGNWDAVRGKLAGGLQILSGAGDAAIGGLQIAPGGKMFSEVLGGIKSVADAPQADTREAAGLKVENGALTAATGAEKVLDRAAVLKEVDNVMIDGEFNPMNITHTFAPATDAPKVGGALKTAGKIVSGASAFENASRGKYGDAAMDAWSALPVEIPAVDFAIAQYNAGVKIMAGAAAIDDMDQVMTNLSAFVTRQQKAVLESDRRIAALQAELAQIRAVLDYSKAQSVIP